MGGRGRVGAYPVFCTLLSQHAMSTTGSLSISNVRDPRPLTVQIPGFEVLTLAGRGAFSEVWKVRDLRDNAFRALKVIRPEYDGQSVARRLLENEAEAGQRVHSPHIMKTDRSQLFVSPRYVVCEWLEGETLERSLRRNGKMPLHTALWVSRQVMQGIADLWAARLIHGDIKPENIFLCGNGLVKLIDLGCCRPVSTTTGRSEELTGTPEYLAPEVLAGQGGADLGRDLYSLGVTMYRLLANRLPFQGETLSEIISQQRRVTPPWLRQSAPELPSDVAQYVHQLLSKHPMRRGLVPELLRRLMQLEVEAIRCECRSHMSA